jgi:hypothetical protein
MTPSHGQRAHSEIGASQAERWMNCPPSVILSRSVPKKEGGPAAEHGTANHEAAEYCLKRNLDAKDVIGKHFNKKKHPYKFDQEDAVAVQVHLDHVRDTLRYYRKKGLKPELLIEKRFHLRGIHKNLYGTSDIIVRIPFLKIIVMDYKNGVRPVEVEENPQLMIYGLGASQDDEGTGFDDYEEIELHIVQPNATHEDGPIRIYKMTYDDLLGWIPTLKKAIKETENPKAAYKYGDHCEYCPAAAICPAMKKAVVAAAKTDFETTPTFKDVESLTDVQVAQVLKHKKLVENYFKSVKDYALQRMVKGEKIKGLKLVKGRGSRNWTNKEVVEEKFGDLIMTEPELMSVSQAEKVIGKAKLKGLWTQYEGNITVAYESDKRKAINSAKDDFTAIEWEVDDEDF